MRPSSIRNWSDVFDFCRSVEPSFDELKAIDRVRGIWQVLNWLRAKTPAFLAGEDLQLRAASAALVSKHGTTPHCELVAEVLAEVFPEHPLLADRRKLSGLYDEMVDGRAQQEQAGRTQPSQLDWAGELKNLRYAQPNVSPDQKSRLVDFILDVFPVASDATEEERTHAFGCGLVALEALKTFSLKGRDVACLAAIGAAWSVDKRRPSKKRVHALLTRVFGTSNTKSKFGYEVLSMKMVYPGETTAGSRRV